MPQRPALAIREGDLIDYLGRSVRVRDTNVIEFQSKPVIEVTGVYLTRAAGEQQTFRTLVTPTSYWDVTR